MEENKAIEPEVEGTAGNWFWVCGECHGIIKWNVKECPHCGKVVKWHE